MGFLAFLWIGGAVAWSAYRFYPIKPRKKLPFSALISLILAGFLGALSTSYGGQALGLFQSGQLLEWFAVIVAAWIAGLIVTALRK